MATSAIPKVKFDDFIKKVRPSAAGTDAMVYVQGYVGESPNRGSVRVYLDPSLNSFIDVPQNDIIHSVAAKDDPNGLGGSKLWIKLPPVTDNTSVGKDYTQGDLFNDYLQKIYEQETKKPGSISPTRNPTMAFGSDVIVPYDYHQGTIGAQTDFTMPATTTIQATDFTKPAATDFTRIIRRRWFWMTDITKVKTIIVTRGCPMGPGGFGNMGNGGYY
jgi:hypothetical protein